MSLPGRLLMRVRRALLEPVYYRRVREPKQRGMIQRCRDAIGTGLGGLTFPLGDRVEFDPEAAVLAVDGWNNRHGRLYDPARLVSRVIGSTPDLSFTVLRIRGVDRQRDGVYACFALVAERTRGSGA